jgi:hypothetical protein
MWICPNLGIQSNKRTIHDACRRNDNLIGWIAMKRAWKLCGFHADMWRKVDEADAGISQSLPKPVEYGTGKNEALPLHELGDLPTRNRGDANAALLGRVDERALCDRQCRIAVNPPNSNMGIENDHCVASQSPSATGSVGAIKETGVPRRE